MKHQNYFITGLKLFVLNFVAGILAWIIALIMGISIVALFQGEIRTITALIYLILLLVAIIYTNGWLAQKLWKWK